MAWLLDTDVFIQAKNLHYGFDFCPGFWDALEHLNLGGRLFSVAKVQEELARGDDDLRTRRGPRSGGVGVRASCDVAFAASASSSVTTAGYVI